MLIKSMSRKNKSFKQLVEYLYQHDESQELSLSYFHNLFGVAEDGKDQIIQAFKENYTYIEGKKRVTMYHEILSWSPEDRAYLLEHPFIIQDLTQKYLERRAPHAIAIATLHVDREHVHMHVMISGNQLGSSRSNRISKKAFASLKQDIEMYQKQAYPELRKSFAQKTGIDSIERSDPLTPQNQPTKQYLESIVKEALTNAHTFEQVIEHLDQEGLQVYFRKSTLQGVIFNKRKWRLRTLLKNTPQLQHKFLKWQKRERSMERAIDFEL